MAHKIRTSKAVSTAPETVEFFGGDELRIRCFLDKYALRDLSGNIIERTPLEMWERVAREIASVEADAKKRREWEKRFYWLLEDFRFIPGGRIMFGAGQPRRATLLNCFPAGTRIWTRHGPKPIEHIEIGEEVLTHRNRFRPVTHTMSREIEEPLRALRLWYLGDQTIYATKEHRFLAFDGATVAWVTAQELTPAHYVRVGRIAPHENDAPSELDLADYVEESLLEEGESDLVYTATAYVGGNGAVGVKESKRVRRKIAVDERFGLWVGFFVAEGGVTDNSVYFTLSKDERPYAEAICELTRQLFGVEAAVQERADQSGHWLRVYAHSKLLAHFVRSFFTGAVRAYEKELPAWFLTAPLKVQKAFIAGLFLGDGVIKEDSVKLFLANPALVRQVFFMLVRLGIVASLRWEGILKYTRHRGMWIHIGTQRYVEALKAWLEGDWDYESSFGEAPQNYFYKVLEGELFVKVKECGWTAPRRLTVYDLSVAEDHSFVAEFAVAHNCYVIPIKEDSIEGIFEWCKEAARTYSLGGGVGTDISILRPKGSPVNNSAIYSSGSVSFMELFSTTTGTIGQSGRRGALMITISVDHPDVLDFIEIKNDPERRKVQYANISVRVTDEFMRAVERDEEFVLRYENERIGRFEKRVRAREIWEKLVKNAWASAEPGVIFWDTVKRESTTEYNGMEVITTNPCSLTGETRVFTPQGLLRLDELVLSATLSHQMPSVFIDRRAQDKKGIAVVAADRVAFTGIKPIWRVETSSGFVLRGTCDHKVKVLNCADYDPEHQSYGWKRIDELKPGDLLALPDLNDDSWVDKVFSERSWELQIDRDYVQPRRRDAHYRLINIPTRWTEDLAYLLGYAVGDGSYTTHSKVRGGHSKRLDLHMHSSEAPELVAIFSRVTQDLLGHECPVKRRAGAQHCWVSIFAAPFQRVLQQLGLHPEKGVAKHVPEPIFRAPKEITAAFLRGLFDADGTISTPSQRPMISLSSISERLIREVQLLLLQFGIFSSMTVYKAEEKNRRRTTPFRYVTVDGEERLYTSKHDVYKLCITSYPCIERFAHYIGSALSAKRQKIEALRAGRTRALRPVTIATEVSRVVQEETCEPVYDLTVLDTKSFIGNGLIVSNSEIPLEAYGACCLGNINLSKFVLDSFTPNARVDWPNLEKALRYATRFLDNVLEYNADRHPLPAQREASLRSRRIGVGFTGFGDMLIKLGLKYDTDEAIAFTDKLFERIKHIVYDESTELAVEKGTFPAFDCEKHLKSAFIKRLDSSLLEKIKKNGLRNAALLTVPPVGSGSVLAGCSSGIEPIFSLSYVRKSKSLSKGEFEVSHPLVREYMEKMGLANIQELPKTFVTAHEIEPMMRVRMQATIQKHIDHAISSTVNLAKDVLPETIGDIYFEAWKAGCKGITVYREGSREGILLTKEEAKEGEKPARATLVPRPRPRVAKGKTYRMKTELGTVFITVNEDEEGIFEVFVQGLGKSGTSTAAFTEAIGRLISLALRSGVKPSAIIDQLSLIRGSRPVVQEDGTVVFSVPDAIAKALAEYLKGGEQLTLLEEVKPRPPQLSEANGHDAKRDVELCPSCGGVLIFTNGCYICSDCGFSECD